MQSPDHLAEDALLGALIAAGGAEVDELTLTGDDFTQNGAAAVYDLLVTMRRDGRNIDLITVSNGLPQQHQGYVFSLDTTVSNAAVFAHADIVAAASLRRKLDGVGDALKSLPASATVAEISERARSLVDAAVGLPQSQLRWVRDIVPTVLESFRKEDTFVPTPWRDLNEAIGGLRPGAVYVIGARPAVGKTVVAAQLATELTKHGAVAFSSLEMSAEELVTRIMSERLEIYVGRFKDARLTEQDWQTIEERRETLDDLRIAVDDRASVTPADIRQHARSVSRGGKLAGIVVDYLQLMSSTSKQDRHVQVSEFSRQLKIMAKDFHVPVIALSQLSRDVESRAEPIPRLSDLRESGAIEQDADVVMLLSRQKIYDGTEYLVLDIAKNRHGEVGEVHLQWQGWLSRAVDR